MPRRWFVGSAGCVFVATLLACGTLVAPLTFSPPTDNASQERALSVKAVEGRPDGLLLRFHAETVPDDARRLQLVRSREGGPASVRREVELDERTSDALTTEGIEYLERSVGSTRETLRYQLRLVGDGGETSVAQSPVTTVNWHSPPARPESLRGRSHMPGTVEIRWKGPNGVGALVFRRDATRSDSKVRRIAEVAPSSSGVFVDRRARPGTVYAYRVALASTREGLTQYGPPSEPVYVMIEDETEGQPDRSAR